MFSMKYPKKCIKIIKTEKIFSSSLGDFLTIAFFIFLINSIFYFVLMNSSTFRSLLYFLIIFFNANFFFIVIITVNRMKFLPMLLYREGITISESIYFVKIRGKRKFIPFKNINLIKYDVKFGKGHSFYIIMKNNKKIRQFYLNPEDFQLIKTTHADYLKNNL